MSFILAGALVALSVLASCASPAGQGPARAVLPKGVTVRAPATLAAGAPLPVPSGEVILTITDASGRHFSLDVAALATLRQVDIDLFEPFEKARKTFSGVLLTDLLDAAGVSGNVALHMVALDEFVADFSASELKVPMVVATSTGGRPIPVDEGGPVRLVFPDDTALTANLDKWIWSVRTITVV